MTAAVHDPALPAVDRLTDRVALGALLDGVGWLDAPRGVEADLRLRWKPGTSLRVGALVPTATGPVAVLVVALPAHAAGKADKVADRAARRGHPVHRAGGVLVVPAAADPDLRGLVPDPAVPPSHRPLSYNPARRWVGRTGEWALKVHATPPPPGVAALLTGPPPGLAAHLPRTVARRGGRVVRSAWVDGTAPGASDIASLRHALQALHGCPVPAGLPVLGYRTVLRAAHQAARATAVALPAEHTRVTTLLATLARACGAGAWPEPSVLVHGDLSPDQVVVTGDGAVLLDLDRAAAGPPDWDGAQWTVAQVADGAGPPLPPPTPTAPLPVLAAALLRAPEPFRRLRPDWAARTSAVLDLAATAAREVS